MATTKCPHCGQEISNSQFGKRPWKLRMLSTVLTGIALIPTAIIVWFYIRSSSFTVTDAGVVLRSDDTNQQAYLYWFKWLAACWAVWVIGPPLWFGFEFQYLYRPKRLNESFEEFHKGQELAAKVWAGFVVLLGALVLKSIK